MSESEVKLVVFKTPVVLLIKGTPEEPGCKFTKRILTLFTTNCIQFSTFNVRDVLQQPLYEGFKTYSNWKTYPQAYVNGKFIGGVDIAEEVFENGDMTKLLEKECPEVIGNDVFKLSQEPDFIVLFLRDVDGRVFEFHVAKDGFIQDIVDKLASTVKGNEILHLIEPMTKTNIGRDDFDGLCVSFANETILQIVRTERNFALLNSLLTVVGIALTSIMFRE
jgi:monothiol glutaredoxin